LLTSGQLRFNYVNAEEAELMACREGLNSAIQLIYRLITLEAECLMICLPLKSKDENRSSLALQLKEVKLLSDELREVEFVHCNRNSNRVAHELANYACREMSSTVWLRCAPNFVAPLVELD
ncbi:hypothetical protein BAE44_0008559, partial [Dichanthelium oligosanthes]